MQAPNDNKYKYFSLGSVKLRIWYKASKISNIELKEITKVSRQMFNYILTGKRRPNKDMIILIEALTNKYVKKSDWAVSLKRVGGSESENNI